MSSHLIHHRGDRFSTLYVSAEDRSLFVAAESDCRRDDEPRALCRLLAAAADEVGTLGDDSPMRMAAIMDTLLREASESAKGPNWCFFLAVLVTSRGVHYSMAGPYRVHLIKNGCLLKFSEDQTVGTDKAVTIKLPPGFEDLASDGTVRNLVTRALGRASLDDGDGFPPVSAVWAEYAPYQIAVCSDGVHRFGKPDAYFNALRDFANSNRVEAQYQEELIAILKT